METGVTADGRPSPAGPQVEYVLDSEDFVDCAVFLWEKGAHRLHRDAARRLVGWLVLFVVILGATFFLWVTEQIGPLAAALVAVAVVLTGALFGVELVRFYAGGPLYRRRLRRQVEQLRALGVVKSRRRDRVTLGSDGFTEVNDWRDDDGGVEVAEHKETRVCWPSVACIDVTEEHAIFTVTGKGYLYVPKRAFPSEEAFLQFVRAAEGLRRAFPPETAGAGGEPQAGPPDVRVRPAK